MADLFENIVTGWLTSKGYFVIQNLKDGRKEHDILAIEIRNGKAGNARHIEVQCSSEPMGYLDGTAKKKNPKQIMQAVKKYVHKKYKDASVQKQIEYFLGKNYTKMFVYGRLKDEPSQVAALKANGIDEVIKVSNIMDELLNMKKKKNKGNFITAYTNRFQQMLKLYEELS